ncbi:hypothetical protein TNCV_3976431 [Trichonephila clavipes]|nr:hypothetical protein TNCV_3976431 [Trichonephila clavipes]
MSTNTERAISHKYEVGKGKMYVRTSVKTEYTHFRCNAYHQQTLSVPLWTRVYHTLVNPGLEARVATGIKGWKALIIALTFQQGEPLWCKAVQAFPAHILKS